MIPCYVDLFYPEVGVAALELLEKLKVDVVYPFDQTCCGQPMANSGCYEEAQATEELFIKNFASFDHIVTPSGSCTHPEFVDFERPDECCGFGGSFSVTEEAVAAQMGYDKVEFMRKAGADYVVSSDMSCIMHLQGCSSRLGTNLKVLHIAQILNGVTQ